MKNRFTALERVSTSLEFRRLAADFPIGKSVKVMLADSRELSVAKVLDYMSKEGSADYYYEVRFILNDGRKVCSMPYNKRLKDEPVLVFLEEITNNER